MSALPDILAIDGGGTRCRVALDGASGRCVVETGGANVSTDLDAAIAQITAGLEDLASQSGRSLAMLETLPAYVGLAGVTGDDMATAVADRLPFRHARVEDDRPAAVRGALGAKDGAVIHCGTGSFQAVQQGGRIRLAGGWGPVLGDEASAQWVGRKALLATLNAHDGLTAPTNLTRALTAKIGTPAQIVAFAAAASPAQFGALAPMVTAQAAQGDTAARGILQDGVDRVKSAVDTLGWVPTLPITLTGGLAAEYEPYLPDDVRAALTAPLAAPIDGALSLARDLALEGAT